LENTEGKGSPEIFPKLEPPISRKLDGGKYKATILEETANILKRRLLK